MLDHVQRASTQPRRHLALRLRRHECARGRVGSPPAAACDQHDARRGRQRHDHDQLRCADRPRRCAAPMAHSPQAHCPPGHPVAALRSDDQYVQLERDRAVLDWAGPLGERQAPRDRGGRTAPERDLSTLPHMPRASASEALHHPQHPQRRAHLARRRGLCGARRWGLRAGPLTHSVRGWSCDRRCSRTTCRQSPHLQRRQRWAPHLIVSRAARLDCHQRLRRQRSRGVLRRPRQGLLDGPSRGWIRLHLGEPHRRRGGRAHRGTARSPTRHLPRLTRSPRAPRTRARGSGWECRPRHRHRRRLCACPRAPLRRSCVWLRRGR